jgi:hypothetical protein
MRPPSYSPPHYRTRPDAPALVVTEPNAASKCLDREQALYELIIRKGGLQKLCCVSQYKYATPPWLKMPGEGRQYQEIDSIPLPANDGLNHVVTQFVVPTGYDGVITSIANFYTGVGFVEGSGDLVWRLLIARRWARNLGNIDTTLGSLTSPCPLFRGGIRVFSDQLITYYVNVPVASALVGGRVVCGVFGWFYPV